MWLLFSIGQRPKGKVEFEEAEWPRKKGESTRLKVILQSKETLWILFLVGPKVGQLLENSSSLCGSSREPRTQMCPGAAEGR